jgi:hypothetical protein
MTMPSHNQEPPPQTQLILLYQLLHRPFPRMGACSRTVNLLPSPNSPRQLTHFLLLLMPRSHPLPLIKPTMAMFPSKPCPLLSKLWSFSLSLPFPPPPPYFLFPLPPLPHSALCFLLCALRRTKTTLAYCSVSKLQINKQQRLENEHQ